MQAHNTVLRPSSNELGEAIDAAVEMIERLEAAEKERDNANAAAAGIALQAETLQAERDALRDKITEMEKQEPVFWWRQCSDETYEGPIHNNSIERVRKQSGAWSPLYALPGAQAQPAPSVPDDNIRGSIRLLKRASGHLRWLKKDAYQWRNLNPKTMRAAELLHRDIDAMLAAAPEAKP